MCTRGLHAAVVALVIAVTLVMTLPVLGSAASDGPAPRILDKIPPT